MAEQLPLKQFVEGSSPPGVTIKRSDIKYQTFFVLFTHLKQCRSERSEEPRIFAVETLRFAQGIMAECVR